MEESSMKKFTFKCAVCGKIVDTEYGNVLLACPDCGKTVTLIGNEIGNAEYDRIVPFSIDRKEIKGLVKAYAGDWFIRPAFLTASMEVEKYYVPFWLFDMEAKGLLLVKGSQYDYRAKSNIRTDLSAYASGNFNIQQLPVDASNEMPDELMDELEPFYYDEMPEMIPDEDQDAIVLDITTSFDECVRRAQQLGIKGTARDVGADLSFEDIAPDTDASKLQYTRMNAKLVLLPVYYVKCRAGRQEYIYTVNGQTGEVTGEKPSSVAKRLLSWLIPIGIPLASILPGMIEGKLHDYGWKLLLIIAVFSLIFLLMAYLPVFGVAKTRQKKSGKFAAHVTKENLSQANRSSKILKIQETSIFKGQSYARAFGQVWLRLLVFVLEITLEALLEAAFSGGSADNDSSSRSRSGSSGSSRSFGGGHSSGGGAGRSHR